MTFTENKSALTVKELIDKLNKMPQDAKVYTEENCGWNSGLVKVVDVLNLKCESTSPRTMLLLITE